MVTPPAYNRAIRPRSFVTGKIGTDHRGETLPRKRPMKELCIRTKPSEAAEEEPEPVEPEPDPPPDPEPEPEPDDA